MISVLLYHTKSSGYPIFHVEFLGDVACSNGLQLGSCFMISVHLYHTKPSGYAVSHYEFFAGVLTGCSSDSSL